eukprot:scaffold249338_cov36-Tisochrysis_lutea.AAC.2
MCSSAVAASTTHSEEYTTSKTGVGTAFAAASRSRAPSWSWSSDGLPAMMSRLRDADEPAGRRFRSAHRAPRHSSSKRPG